MARVSLDHVGKEVSGARGKPPARILDDISLEVDEGEFLVLVGSSGCGKTTLLRCIAGLEEISRGELRFDGARMNETAPRDRDVAMVFQSYALYPHLTVRDNLAFGLRLRKTPRDEIERRVREAAAMLEIEALLDRLPRALSGGQQQRVAMGRAVVRRPRVFLFDEPLSNLDASLRGQMRVELKRLHARLGATMIYVTHDQVEAMTLADRIAMLRGGRVEQVGTPESLYRRPETRAAALFFGSPPMNQLEGAAAAGCFTSNGLRLPLAAGGEASGPCALGVRAEDVLLEDPSATGLHAGGRVDVLENLGAEALVHLVLDETRRGDEGVAGGGEPFPERAARLVARVEVTRAPQPGARVGVRLRQEAVHLFSLQSGRRLSP